jgi:EAL domain-containing protein (putative c-di-GMP-specific phosphodiesterase class I)/ActR/RegA family two-component response regulator
MDRLLVVDDEPELARFVGRVGESIGYDVKAISVIQEFKDLVGQWKPDVIILDLAMPQTDGLELLNWLASENCPAQIIIMSGFDARIVESAKRIGQERGLNIAFTFNKPIRVQDLKDQLMAIRQLKPVAAPFSESELRNGFIESQLFVAYQPQVSLKSGALRGAEALIRWNHPTRGIIPAEQFLDVVAETDLSWKLSTLMITEAIRQQGLWSQRGLDIQMAINLSLSDLQDKRLADQISFQCYSENVPPERVTIEVAESSIMSDAIEIFDVLARLRLRGFQLSIDDFGTGFSSLTRLQRMPATELKIDKSLVSDAQTSANSLVIVKAIISLAKIMNLSSVAEGIETAEHYELMAKLGCEQGQGFGIAKPMMPDAFLKWNAEWNAAEFAIKNP